MKVVEEGLRQQASMYIVSDKNTQQMPCTDIHTHMYASISMNLNSYSD